MRFSRSPAATVAESGHGIRGAAGERRSIGRSGRAHATRYVLRAPRSSLTTTRAIAHSAAFVKARMHMTDKTITEIPIPAQRYDFPDEDVELILTQFGALLRSRSFLTMGRYCTEFEKGYAQYVGTAHA